MRVCGVVGLGAWVPLVVSVRSVLGFQMALGASGGRAGTAGLVGDLCDDAFMARRLDRVVQFFLIGAG